MSLQLVFLEFFEALLCFSLCCMFDQMTRSYLKAPYDDMTTNRFGSTQTILNQVTDNAVELTNLRMTAAWSGQILNQNCLRLVSYFQETV